MRFTIPQKLLLPLVGLISGLLNGLLGAGGGIAIVYGLRQVLLDRGAQEGDVLANALCCMLPISAVSCLFYAFRGNLSLSGFGDFFLPAVLGGLLGGLLLDKLHAPVLKKLFASLVALSGLLLLIR